MDILLCAATPQEIEPLNNFIHSQTLHEVRTLITGVGLTATAYQITKAISKKNPDLIIQAGMAGSFDSNLALGQVVAVTGECFGDLGVQENGDFMSLFEMGLEGKNAFPWTEGWLVNQSPILESCSIMKVKALSVNQISTSDSSIFYYKNLGASTESMEGAALHYVALMESVPFLQLRSISNYAGERDKNKWRIKDAISNLSQELKQLLINTPT
jgi:futalosine hydrolase